MLTKDEFNQWCDKLSFSEATIELIKRIREEDPSRRVGGGRKNVTGAYPSRKMGMSIQFESHKVELAGIYIKEHDSKVREYYDQPSSIKLKYKSYTEKVVTLFHTPDYFVIYDDQAGWEEWKTEEELNKLAQESPNRYTFIDGYWRCPPGEEYAEQFGLNYWLKSNSEINWILQRNFIFLEDYLMDEKKTISQKMVNLVLSKVNSNPGVLLIDHIGDSGVESDVIYYMIAKNLIFVDLNKEALAEPEYTHVYRDKESSFALQALLSAKKVPLISNLSLNIAPGVKILWDGQPWLISNVGTNQIYLSSSDGTVGVDKDHFYRLVFDHHIQGAENEVSKEVDSAIFSKVSGASEQALKEANRRYDLISQRLGGDSIGNLGCIDVTERTVRNWMRDYKQAENLYGSGFIGLIPNTSKRGNRMPHLPVETLSITNDFLDENENPTNQSINLLYGKLEILCKSKGIICPSKKTFCKIIKTRPKYQRIMKTKGSRAAYQHATFYWELDMTTPRHGERPFEIGHIDHTELDIQLKHSKTGKDMGRAWLTTMLDAFSRRVLAFWISFYPPSYVSDMMVIRECVRRFGRLPQIIVTDGGRDFRSINYESLLALYGITKKQRPPHKARFGSVMERLFGTTLTQVIHNLKGNTKLMKDPRQVSSSFNPINHSVWTLPKLYEILTEYFYDFYDQREHSALCETPKDAFERGMTISGKRSFRFIPYNEEFLIMTLPIVKRNQGTSKVDHQRGVKVNNRYYYCDQLSKPSLEGTYISVRYDPFNMGIVYCYISGNWVKCYSEYYSIFQNRSEKEIMVATEELRKSIKDHAARANISAKELADFLSRAENIENELLRQRQVDEELTTQLHVINGGHYDSSNDDIEYKGIRDPDFYAKLDFSLSEDD